jgi:hypothetical protein
MDREAWMMDMFKGFVGLMELNPEAKEHFRKLLER